MKKLSTLFVLLVTATVMFAQPCSKLFFSEYVEGSSNNKALEVYNPTASPISLAGYRILHYNNGADTARFVFNMSGTVPAYGTYVLANSNSAASILAVADTASTSSVFNFNGNDVLALLNPANDTLDRLGAIGVSANFKFGTDDAVDHTFVRLSTVQEGTKDWLLGTTQWITFPKDTIRLGSHTSSCAPITDTLVSFSQTAATVSESAGTQALTVILNAASLSSTFTADVVLKGGTGTAADINNYTTQTVTFAPTIGSQTVTVTITDDAIPEGAETLIFALRNVTGGVLLSADSIFTLTIAPSDLVATPHTIASITGLDGTFSPDSLNSKVIVSGTVYGINDRATGLEFFIHDATDGVQVFSPSNNFGYVVAEGDSVAVQGTVGFFSGVIQLATLDTVYKLGTHALRSPLVVQDLDETTEAELVRLNGVHLVTPSQWDTTAHASGFNADITDGTTTWVLRVDEQTNIYTTNMAAPTGNFDVIGMGSQFDGSSPYNSGYQILPRYKSDIIQNNAINETEGSFVSVYPNPNNGSFYLALNTAGTTTDVKVYSITGETVYTAKSAEQIIKVSTTGLANGMYIVEARNNNKVYRSKIQVQQ